MFGSPFTFGPLPLQPFSGTTVKFVPPLANDTAQKGALSTTVTTKHMVITAMREYESKSLEELRLEDYMANRRRPAPGSTVGPPPVLLFGSGFGTPSVSQPAATASGTMFGQPLTTQTTSTSGATATQPTQQHPFFKTTTPFGSPSGLFGTAASTTPTTGGLFGTQPATTTAPTGAAAHFAFGATPTPPPVSSTASRTAPTTGGLSSLPTNFTKTITTHLLPTNLVAVGANRPGSALQKSDLIEMEERLMARMARLINDLKVNQVHSSNDASRVKMQEMLERAMEEFSQLKLSVAEQKKENETLKQEVQKFVAKKCDQSQNARNKTESIDQSRPVLQRPGYSSVPKIADLQLDGNKWFADEFQVCRAGFGSVTFHGRVELSGLNLDQIIEIEHGEIVVYPDEAVKPPVGQGLNRPSTLTLEGIFPEDKTTREATRSPEALSHYKDYLHKMAGRLGAEFIEYRPETGSWVIKVPHFSHYSLF